VYADWLLERGIPYGEFVQASLAMEKAPLGSARWSELEDAEYELERHALRWWGPLRTAVPNVRFRRGLVSEMRVQASRLPAIFQQLVQRAPLAIVSIDGLAKSRWRLLAPVLRCPLGNLYGLEISDEMSDKHLVELAAAPTLAGLRRLWVHGAGGARASAAFTDTGACQLVRSPQLQKSLATLSLVKPGPHLPPRLPKLGVRLSGEAARAIALNQPQLRALSIGLNNLGELEPLFRHAHLHEVVLKLDSLTQAHLDAFLASPLARQLVLLYIEADAGKVSGASLKRLKALPGLRYQAVRIGREPGSGAWRKEDLAQLYGEEHVSRGKNGASVTYSLNAMLRDGRRVKMLKGLTERAQVLWLERTLEGRMSIVDVPVTGELQK
jgi:hypothetical protein